MADRRGGRNIGRPPVGGAWDMTDGLPESRQGVAAVGRQRPAPRGHPGEERRHCDKSARGGESLTKTKLLSHVPEMTIRFVHSVDVDTFPMATGDQFGFLEQRKSPERPSPPQAPCERRWSVERPDAHRR